MAVYGECCESEWCTQLMESCMAVYGECCESEWCTQLMESCMAVYSECCESKWCTQLMESCMAVHYCSSDGGSGLNGDIVEAVISNLCYADDGK